MILLIIYRYLFWWISTFMESTYFVERWLTSHRGTPNTFNPSEGQYTSIFYLFTVLIVVVQKSTKEGWCVTQSSSQFCPTPNCILFNRAPVDTLTPSEEPLSNTLFLNPSRDLLVFDYYQVTARLLRSFVSSPLPRLRRSFQINHYASLHHNTCQSEWRS